MSPSRLAFPFAFVWLSACTWVEPTKEGSQVLLINASDVESCTRVGTANSSVKHKVGVFTRGEEKVKDELITLARNKAAEMGGDSIVARGEPSEGTMSFDIYRCRDE